MCNPSLSSKFSGRPPIIKCIGGREAAHVLGSRGGLETSGAEDETSGRSEFPTKSLRIDFKASHGTTEWRSGRGEDVPKFSNERVCAHDNQRSRDGVMENSFHKINPMSNYV